ncbi:MAG TPA: type VI secretion system contractile sheath small subunit [Pyrinomonadaceae bacterium]|jgi:type VI secretion system protein ImpB|nr:type VI secretion system contractile sheath small subunit [Pyrinomonadaceae bacterium]
MPESIQHKLDRVRRPRVQITYDVETLGSIVKTELPFVVGIMADLSGNAIPTILEHPQPAKVNPTLLKDRKYVEIDRDNFDTIMEKVKPTVKLSNGDEVTFKRLEDFDPINVLRNVSSLNALFDSRTRLSNLVAKLDGNVALQKEFIDAYNNLMDDADSKTAIETYYKVVKDPPPAPGTLRITPAITTGVAQTTDGLVVTLNPDDVDKVKLFKITEIKGGKVFDSKGKEIKADGTTPVDAVKLGFKFTPDKDSKAGSFTVAATDQDGKELPGFSTQTASITINAAPVTEGGA